MNKKNITLVLINVIISCMLIYFYIINKLPTSIIICNLIFFVLYCFTIAYFIKSIKDASNTLENYKNYNSVLSTLYDNIRAFKHDFHNIIYTIGGFIDTNDITNLKKYYTSISKDCQKINNLSVLDPNIVNNSGIYSLLLAKYQKAQENNVIFNIECFLDFTKLHISTYHLSRILGILIDNAIEAASCTDEKKVNILFRDSINNKTQLIKIENTYSNKNVDTAKIFEKGITEKENHSGIGLWQVKQILKQNKNVKLLTSNNENYFKQQLEIYYT